jgi:RimJ/RimL family protein N-acetyltransferase
MDDGSHPWGLYHLRIWTERLELRLPTEDELVELLLLAKSGIHDPNVMPFGFAWTDQPSPLFERSLFQYHWSTRAGWSPDSWNLDLGVWLDGRLIGNQSIGAKQFGILRSVDTGSWLAREFQGRGVGKEMRSAVLGFAFDHLDAQQATSGAFSDNPASAAVSKSLGYDENGVDLVAPRGEARHLVRYRITRDQWYARERPRVEVGGLEHCWDMFGAG